MEKLIKGIKVISFDGDGALWNFDQVMRRALTATLEKLVVVYPYLACQLSVEKMIEVRERVARELRGKVFNLEEIRF